MIEADHARDRDYRAELGQVDLDALIALRRERSVARVAESEFNPARSLPDLAVPPAGRGS